MANLSTSVSSLPNLGPGSSGADVLSLQNALVAAGYLTQAQVQSGPGTYGPQTTAAVAKWQSDNGINTAGNPGYFGPASKSYVTGGNTQSQQPTQQPVQQQPTQTSTPSTPTYTPPATQQPTQSPTSTGRNPTLPASLLSSVTGNLGPGSTGSQVQALQQALVANGYMTAQQMATGPGTYGPQTTAAVAQWQADNGIDTQGNPGYFGPVSHLWVQGHDNATSIDPNQTKDDYSGTQNGQVNGADTTNNAPDGSLPQGVNNALNGIPKDTFTSLTPQLVPGTPEYQAAMDKIDTSYYDILQQQMTANTEQQKQVADYNWSQLKDYISTNLGISLSNDAVQAWDQVQGLKDQYGALNLEGSGIQNESVDDYLKKVRLSDASARTQAQSKDDEAQQAYYTSYATPEQVKAFAASNPDKAKSWGLIPSDAIKSALTPAALKAKYPNMTDAQIQATIASTLDENGNYRSSLYQKYMTGSNTGIDMGSIDPSQVTYDQYGNITGYGSLKPTDTGVLDIQATKTQDQQKNVEAASAAKALGTVAAEKDALPTSIQSGPTDATTNQYLKSNPASGNPSAGTPPAGSPAATTTNPIPTQSPYQSTSTPNTNTSMSSAPAYTFKTNASGMIERYNNGQREATGTADSMKSYGYTGS